MLKGTRPKATWNDDDVIRAQLRRGKLTLKIIYLTTPRFFKFSISVAEKPKSFIISSVCSPKSGALD
jgi:hypothetical protein